MANILIIEDDDIVAELLADALRLAGHMVGCAMDAEEALASIHAAASDLIVVDYELPGASGLQVARELRTHRHSADTPVIMMTANRSKLLRARASAEGVTVYLNKPIWPDAFVVSVEELLRARCSSQSRL